MVVSTLNHNNHVHGKSQRPRPYCRNSRLNGSRVVYSYADSRQDTKELLNENNPLYYKEGFIIYKFIPNNIKKIKVFYSLANTTTYSIMQFVGSASRTRKPIFLAVSTNHDTLTKYSSCLS